MSEGTGGPDGAAVALTIAGSDSSGGAGIQADIKAMSALGVFSTSVITALTAQNTQGVSGVHAVPPAFVRAQIDAVFTDIRIDAVKVGMLADAGIIRAVADGLRRWHAPHVVLDPVMVTTSGDPLIDDTAVDTLIAELFPLAVLVTPNLAEAARLTGRPRADSEAEMARQAFAILATGPAAVLVKGGHFDSPEARDVLVWTGGQHWFEAPRIATRNTHGTGCSLSSAIAAGLALGRPLPDAIGVAKAWLGGAIAAADTLRIGHGPGPIHHFHDFWTRP